MSTPSPHGIPHETGTDTYIPGPADGSDVTIERMYYTFCVVCRTAFNDWSDTMTEARRNRAHHLEWHKQSAATPAPMASEKEPRDA